MLAPILALRCGEQAIGKASSFRLHSLPGPAAGSDMAIRGHVFCSFLALLLVKELEDRLHRHNIAAEWDDILRDLDRLQEIELEQDGKRFLLRTPTTGVAGKLFQA